MVENMEKIFRDPVCGMSTEDKAAAMSLRSVSAVDNALRLKRFNRKVSR